MIILTLQNVNEYKVTEQQLNTTKNNFIVLVKHIPTRALHGFAIHNLKNPRSSKYEGFKNDDKLTFSRDILSTPPK